MGWGGTRGHSLVSFTCIYMNALSQHESVSREAEKSRQRRLIPGDVCGGAALRSVEVCPCVWKHFTQRVCQYVSGLGGVGSPHQFALTNRTAES